MPANWDENRISVVLRTTTQIVLSETLTIDNCGLIFSKAAGYLPASIIGVSICAKTTYSTQNGGGGNCTRGQTDANTESEYCYGNCPLGWPEMGREDDALRELVVSWHRLTPDVTVAIMQLVRGRGSTCLSESQADRRHLGKAH